jgi:hypothetical protein
MSGAFESDISKALFVLCIFILACFDALFAVKDYAAVSWVFTAIIILFIIGAVGARQKGSWLGLLLDNRNALSLSQLQLLMWFLLIVNAGIKLSNYGGINLSSST